MYRQVTVVQLVWVLLLAACGVARSQGTGTLHGMVTDPSGAALPAAQVTATLDERGTTRAVKSDLSGAYVLPLLPVGTYTLTVQAQGFKTFVQHGIGLTSNENVRVDATLQVGNVSESVTVSAEAPLVDTRSAVMGALIDSRRVLELPINGRNVIGLATLLPGASQVSAPQTFTGDRSGPTVSMSGSRGNQNLFLFDGAHFNAVFRNTGLNYPPPDALQEVKVLTNSFSAEYGRNAGTIFNVVTRSGSNEIHGSVWEFLRNHKLNARNFFAPSGKPKLVQNQYGAAAGGPLRKDRLFVFGSYEGLKVRPASLSTAAYPPTAAERIGDLSSSRTAVRDPLTGQPFPGDRIPMDRFDAVTRNILSREMLPLPNRPDGQLVTTSPRPQDDDTFLVRVDYNLRRHTIDARYNYSLAADAGFTGSIPTWLPVNRSAKSQNITLGDTVGLKPNLLNQARLSFNRLYSVVESQNRLHLSDLGGNFPVFGPRQPPAITISGRVELGTASGGDAIQVNESLQFSDSLYWTKGAHSVKGGFELLKLRYLNRSSFRTMGTFTFDGTITGNAVADFLLGKPAQMTVASPLLEQAGLGTNTFYFLQDDWRIHSRLTLNLGLRYELPLPWVHPQDLWGSIRIGQQSQKIKTAPVGMVFPNDPGVPRGLVQTDKNNFAPRFGFAWDLFGNGRTSLRGAYGIFYETINADIVQNTSQPFSYTFTIPTPYSLTDPLRGQPPIPLYFNLVDPAFVGTQQLFYPDPSLRSPYVQHFNLSLQRQLTADVALQVGYVGKLGRKLLFGWTTNPGIYGPGATASNIDQRRAYRPFGQLNVISSLANSRYNGLQAELNKRFSRGFSLQGAYTYSRSIDMGSSISLGAGVPNVFDLSTQFGLSDFHAKHIASFSWLWEVPSPAWKIAAVRHTLGGWQVNGVVNLRSGMPFNLLIGRDVALSGTSNQRPNVVGEHRLSSDRARADRILAWFNRAAFASPATGAYGNVGRNALLGPASASANSGIFKHFRLPGREGLRLQFRAEFFNLFNSVNLGNPNNQLSAGERMGRITSADNARVIQFALKVLF